MMEQQLPVDWPSIRLSNEITANIQIMSTPRVGDSRMVANCTTKLKVYTLLLLARKCVLAIPVRHSHNQVKYSPAIGCCALDFKNQAD